MRTPPSLCNLPDVVATNIFDRVGFKSIQNLRKVCRSLRIRIDDIEPEAHLVYVYILVTDCGIQFVYYSKKRSWNVEKREDVVEYEKTEESGRSIVRSDGSEKIVNGDFVELALRDLQLILKFQKQRLQSIAFANESEYSNNFLQFLETLKCFLALENRLLKVDEFGINLIHTRSVITALSLIDPQSIESMTLFTSNESIQPMEFTEIVEMEHWKNAKCFTSNFIITGVSAHNFLHFPHFEVTFQSISVEELLDLKKNFQNSTEADVFSIQYDTFEDKEQFFEKMGPAVRTDSDDFEWFFRMSTSDDYVLWIRLNDLLKSIQFSRKAVADVPEHAVIQN